MKNINFFEKQLNISSKIRINKKLSSAGLACVVAAMVPMTGITGEVDERGLYDLAPENSAFVRLINLTAQTQKVHSNEVDLSVIGHCAASSYQPIQAGSYVFQSDGEALTSAIDANLAYSVVVDYSGMRLIVDKMVESPRKSLVAVYNFTSRSGLSVKTANGQHSVFSQLSSGDYAFREINPVKVSFSIFSEDKNLSDVKAIVFERGVVSSLLLCERDGAIATTWARQ